MKFFGVFGPKATFLLYKLLYLYILSGKNKV